MPKLEQWSPQILALLRIVTALLFLEHGLVKLFGFPTAFSGTSGPLPPLVAVAAVIELAGGALIAAGLFTRIAALICSGEMAVAYFMAHLPASFWPAINRGESAILFCFVFLYLVFAGPGAFSLDNALRGTRSVPVTA
jgi:putative oxidoreductase